MKLHETNNPRLHSRHILKEIIMQTAAIIRWNGNIVGRFSRVAQAARIAKTLAATLVICLPYVAHAGSYLITCSTPSKLIRLDQCDVWTYDKAGFERSRRKLHNPDLGSWRTDEYGNMIFEIKGDDKGHYQSVGIMLSDDTHE